MTPTLGFCDGKMDERSGGLISLWSVRLSFLISMLSPALSPQPLPPAPSQLRNSACCRPAHFCSFTGTLQISQGWERERGKFR